MWPKELKCILVGAPGVGKTKLLLRYQYGTYTPRRLPLEERIRFLTPQRPLAHTQQIVTTTVLDIPIDMPRLRFNIIIYVVDMSATDAVILSQLNAWFSRQNYHQYPQVLVGNKNDLLMAGITPEQTELRLKTLYAKCDHRLDFVPIIMASAMTGHNVENIFLLALEVYALRTSIEKLEKKICEFAHEQIDGKIAELQVPPEKGFFQTAKDYENIIVNRKNTRDALNTLLASIQDDKRTLCATKVAAALQNPIFSEHKELCGVFQRVVTISQEAYTKKDIPANGVAQITIPLVILQMRDALRRALDQKMSLSFTSRDGTALADYELTVQITGAQNCGKTSFLYRCVDPDLPAAGIDYSRSAQQKSIRCGQQVISAILRDGSQGAVEGRPEFGSRTPDVVIMIVDLSLADAVVLRLLETNSQLICRQYNIAQLTIVVVGNKIDHFMSCAKMPTQEAIQKVAKEQKARLTDLFGRTVRASLGLSNVVIEVASTKLNYNVERCLSRACLQRFAQCVVTPRVELLNVEINRMLSRYQHQIIAELQLRFRALIRVREEGLLAANGHTAAHREMISKSIEDLRETLTLWQTYDEPVGCNFLPLLIDRLKVAESQESRLNSMLRTLRALEAGRMVAEPDQRHDQAAQLKLRECYGQFIQSVRDSIPFTWVSIHPLQESMELCRALHNICLVEYSRAQIPAPPDDGFGPSSIEFLEMDGSPEVQQQRMVGWEAWILQIRGERQREIGLAFAAQQKDMSGPSYSAIASAFAQLPRSFTLADQAQRRELQEYVKVPLTEKLTELQTRKTSLENPSLFEQMRGKTWEKIPDSEKVDLVNKIAYLQKLIMDLASLANDPNDLLQKGLDSGCFQNGCDSWKLLTKLLEYCVAAKKKPQPSTPSAAVERAAVAPAPAAAPAAAARPVAATPPRPVAALAVEHDRMVAAASLFKATASPRVGSPASASNPPAARASAVQPVPAVVPSAPVAVPRVAVAAPAAAAASAVLSSSNGSNASGSAARRPPTQAEALGAAMSQMREAANAYAVAVSAQSPIQPVRVAKIYPGYTDALKAYLKLPPIEWSRVPPDRQFELEALPENEWLICPMVSGFPSVPILLQGHLYDLLTLQDSKDFASANGFLDPLRQKCTHIEIAPARDARKRLQAIFDTVTADVQSGKAPEKKLDSKSAQAVSEAPEERGFFSKVFSR